MGMIHLTAPFTEDKIRALEAVGVKVADHPEQIPDLLANL